MLLSPELATKKIAIFHAFFKCRGGAEKLVFQMRNHYKADVWAGALDTEEFRPDQTDSFAKELFNPQYTFRYLHQDSKVPIWYFLKRLWHLAFNPLRKKLLDYDIIIFSGNLAFIQGFVARQRTKNSGSQVRMVNYCNTPPRKFTDQKSTILSKLPIFARPFYQWLSTLAITFFKSDLEKSDLLISNSENIKNRIQTYLGLDSKAIFVPVQTDRFRYISTQDYYLSHSRLEELKRIPLIIEAFAKMPDKQLIICSSGPLASWVQDQINTRNLKNITYEGIVSDERLDELVGNCLAGIVIPVDEDAGIVQCELMAAGKPVIGVQEGGLIETVIDKKTGILLPKNPTVEQLMQGVEWMDKSKAISMKEGCILQGKKFDSEVFFNKLDQELKLLVQ